MAKKQRGQADGIVFSTDPSFRFEEEQVSEETIDRAEQPLVISLDKKQRAGKAVTLIEGFVGKEEDLQTLGKSLKTQCGTGGSAKEGVILVQGDNRDKILTYLKKEGYKKARIRN